ncbi:hypothetical protein [Streptomyces sp. NPDC059564]|uniref:hypothetical protein n=1 Tax=Streptomyces sp. NPDC059564 TaxID=3346865 RepID=UPI003681E1FC
MRWTTDTLLVVSGLYYLVGEDAALFNSDEDGSDRVFEGNTLAAGGPEHLTLLAGTHTGAIRLTVERPLSEPGPPASEWDTVVDVSIYSTSGKLWLNDGEGETRSAAGNLAHTGPGWYRVRAHARGRDRGEAEGIPDAWVEEHLMSIWPAPAQHDLVHRVTDAFGTAYHDPERPPSAPIYPAEALPWAERVGDAKVRAWAKEFNYGAEDQARIVEAINAAGI